MTSFYVRNRNTAVPVTYSYYYLFLSDKIGPFPQAFHNKLMTLRTPINVPYIVCHQVSIIAFGSHADGCLPVVVSKWLVAS